MQRLKGREKRIKTRGRPTDSKKGNEYDPSKIKSQTGRKAKISFKNIMEVKGRVSN